MATSSILGGEHVPEHVKGKDTNALGPSDNSDSGSDSQGVYGGEELSSDSDAVGTGERASAGFGGDALNADIMPDHIEGAPNEFEAENFSIDEQLDDASDVQSLAEDEDDDDDDSLDDENDSIE